MYRRFLYVCTLYSFLLIFSFVIYGFMWEGPGGGGGVVRKTYCTGPCKLPTILLYNPSKSPVGARLHKTTHEPLIDKVLCVMLYMRANPLLGKMGGG
jgi:hypothetical protein